MSPAELSTLLGIVAVCGGFLGWYGGRAWDLSKKDSSLAQATKDIKDIKEQCGSKKKEIQAELQRDINGLQKELDTLSTIITKLSDKIDSNRAATLDDLKSAVCDAIRFAMSEQEKRWIEKQAALATGQAVLSSEVEQIKADVDNLFKRVRDLEAKVK